MTATEIQDNFMKTIKRIDKLEVTPDKCFELQLMASCARYIEDVVLEEGVIPDLTYVDKCLDKFKE